jgi:hypothetical protein
MQHGERRARLKRDETQRLGCIQIGSREISRSLQWPFRYFAPFRVIKTIREFLFVGMATTS